MSRIRRILQAAAALIVAGAAVAVGIQQANDADVDPMTCRQWSRSVLRQTEALPDTFFVAVKNGTNPPRATSTKVLGECAAGVCSIEMNGCGNYPGYAYKYRRSPLAGGWRLYKVTATPYITDGWREAAAEDVNIAFFDSFKALKSKCLGALTGAQCLTLIGGVHSCWKLGSGNLCRFGREYGPGLGGETFCTPDASSEPYPCVNHRGRVWLREVTECGINGCPEP